MNGRNAKRAMRPLQKWTWTDLRPTLCMKGGEGLDQANCEKLVLFSLQFETALKVS